MDIPPAITEEPVPAAIHIHSDISSGGRPLADIAALAQKQNVRILILTDLYDEKYEYGLWPLQSLIKWTLQRNSVMKLGPEKYLKAIQEVSKQFPNILLIDGAAVTPFYFWSGNLWPGPLVLNDRAKDMLVLGLGDAAAYRNLPVIQNGKSGFNAYAGERFSKPYQQVIDDVRKTPALIFWSHPYAEEHDQFDHLFLGRTVYLDTPAYVDSLSSTFDYTGTGVYSSELAQIDKPEKDTTISPHGMWDRVLNEYCRGERKSPAWIIGEVDYNGMPDGIKSLDEILNMIWSPQISRQGVLDAIRRGRHYIIIPASHEKRLMLDDYKVSDTVTGKSANSGEWVMAANPLVQIKARFSDGSTGQLRLMILRNGALVRNQIENIPLDLQWPDPELPTGKNYYRVMGYSEDAPNRLATNPIFVEKS